MLNRNVPNDPGELAAILGPLEPGTPVVFESGIGWSWLAELLDDLGLETTWPTPCGAGPSPRPD